MSCGNRIYTKRTLAEPEMIESFCENTHLPSELLDTCFYGNFKFMKL